MSQPKLSSLKAVDEKQIVHACPHCHRLSGFEVAMSPVYNDAGRICGMTETAWRESSTQLWKIFVCSNCHKPLLVLNEFTRHYPYCVIREVSSKLPANIHRELDQARRCLEVKCYDATMFIIIRLLNHYIATKVSGASHTVETRLDQMCKSGMITQLMADCISRVLHYQTPKTDKAVAETVATNYRHTHDFFHMLYGFAAMDTES